MCDYTGTEDTLMNWSDKEVGWPRQFVGVAKDNSWLHPV